MLKRGKTFYIVLLCLVLIPFLLISCTITETSNVLTDILTMKASDRKIKITMQVNDDVSMEEFERAVEEKFSDVDLVLTGTYVTDYDAETVKRLENNDLADLACFASPDAGEAYFSARLVDLSSFAFSSNYTISSLDAVRKSGRIFMLPLPGRVEGIVYNKTKFSEKGFALPTDFDGFCALNQTIADGGVRGLHLSLADERALSRAFVAFGYQAAIKDGNPEWLKAYNARESGYSFSQMRPAYDNFLQLMKFSAMLPSGADNDFDFSSPNLAAELLCGESMMAVGGTSLVSKIDKLRATDAGAVTDEFALMPFYSGGVGSDWVDYRVPAYYGMNKEIVADAEKYGAAIKIMEFLSSSEGQAVLMNEGNGDFSPLSLPVDYSSPLLKGIESTLRRGQYVSAEPFRKFTSKTLAISLQDAFYEKDYNDAVTDQIVGESVPQDEVFLEIVRKVDAANAQTAEEKGAALGTAAETFTLTETGSFIADAMRSAANTEFALYPDMGKDGNYNGTGVAAKFYTGQIYLADVLRVLPREKKNTGKLVRVLMRGEEIVKALENVNPAVTGNDGFYYVSGLIIRFCPTATIGERVINVTKSDGTPLGKNTGYYVAIASGTVNPAFFIGAEEDTGHSISKVVRNAIVGAGTIRPPKDNRMTILSKS